MWLIWTAGIAALGAFVIYTAFPLVYMLASARKKGIWIPVGPRVVGWIWFGLGAVGNLVHNWFVASIIFRELSFELATTHRIQRYVDQGPNLGGWRYHKAVKWARFLNYADPGHIKGVK